MVSQTGGPFWLMQSLALAALLAGLNMASAKAPVAAPSEYQIGICDDPVRIVISAAPQLDAIGMRKDYISCGARELREMEASNVYADPVPGTSLPKLAIVRQETRINLELEIPTASGPQRFHAHRVVPDGKLVTFVASQSAAQPAPQVRVSRLSDQPYVSLNVLNSSTKQLLADLIRLKHIKVRELTPLPEKQVSVTFEIISIDHVLGLLADVSGYVLQRDGNGGYLLGRMWHQAELAALRAELEDLDANQAPDRAAREKLLEEIVTLAGKPGPDNELPPGIAFELEELVNLAVETNTPKRAEQFSKQWMAEIERQGHSQKHVEYARAQVALARARLAQNNSADASRIFTAALPILATDRPLETLPLRAEVWSQLALIELKTGQIATARANADRAYTLLSSQESKALEAWQCYGAYGYAMEVYAELSQLMR